MEGQNKTIRQGIQKLIKESCDFDKQPNEEFRKFHKSFFKFSFGALDVEVDYDKKMILVWNSKPSNVNTIDLHSFKEAFFEKVNYTDLEETLLGCVEVGVFNERFYKHLLYDHDRLQSEDGMKIA